MTVNEAQIPNKITTGKTALYQKDIGKGNARDNYKSISYFPLMYILMAGILCNCSCVVLEINDKLPTD